MQMLKCSEVSNLETAFIRGQFVDKIDGWSSIMGLSIDRVISALTTNYTLIKVTEERYIYWFIVQ